EVGDEAEQPEEVEHQRELAVREVRQPARDEDLAGPPETRDDDASGEEHAGARQEGARGLRRVCGDLRLRLVDGGPPAGGTHSPLFGRPCYGLRTGTRTTGADTPKCPKSASESSPGTPRRTCRPAWRRCPRRSTASTPRSSSSTTRRPTRAWWSP